MNDTVAGTCAPATSGLNTTCGKCGVQSVRVRYMSGIEKMWMVCQCCGYEYYELPLDHPERKTLATVTPLRPVG